MAKAGISAVVNTLNCEKWIEGCLDSVAWADEIVVVDMHSDDGSVEIARRFTDRIFTHERQPVVEVARNFGIEQASNDWIFILDPDERCTPTLAKKVREVIDARGDTLAGIAYPSMTIVLGKWLRHTGWWPAHQLRVFRKDRARYSGDIHAFPDLCGEILDLEPIPENSIVHFNYDSIGEFVTRMNRYTDVEAAQRLDRGRRFSLFRLVGVPVAMFLRRYVRQQGFRDGFHGFLMSLLMAVYYFLVYAKIWESTRSRDKEFSASDYGVER
jgi:glycosyltransferase involved in cell wall biosynthesis